MLNVSIDLEQNEKKHVYYVQLETGGKNTVKMTSAKVTSADGEAVNELELTLSIAECRLLAAQLNCFADHFEKKK